MAATHYILAGGGTGGHLYPGITVAEVLRDADAAAEITFLTTTRDLDRQLLAKHGFAQVTQPVRPFSTRPWHWPGFWWAWRRSVAAATRLMDQRRPRAVLGLGGYAAGPPLVAARQLGIPTAILNPDAIPGRANRYLAQRVERAFVQWEASARHFPAGVRCEPVGCPIRRGFLDVDRAAGCAHFGLEVGRPVLLVTGASQGARTVNEAMMRVWPEFAQAHPAWQLLHLTGPADEEAVKSAYAAADAPARVLSFTHEMPLAIAAADLVVSRAGASTLAELTAVGRPAILLPYPYHRDQHQRANGQVLADAGAALLLTDHKDPTANAGPLRTALDECADPSRRVTMAAAAESLGCPDAASAVAVWMQAAGA